MKAASLGDSKDATELLALIKIDLPLTWNTDLFGYVLSDSYQFSVIQRVFAAHLRRGDAAVFDARTGELLSSIEVRINNSTGARRHRFYSRDTMLMQGVDCIEY